MSYIEILSGLLKAFKNGDSGGGHFLGDEKEIAEKILDAMGENPGTRRKWLSKLRKHFFGLDKFRNGSMPGPKLVKVLKELSVRLTRSEEGRLLELLPTIDEEVRRSEELSSASRANISEAVPHTSETTSFPTRPARCRTAATTVMPVVALATGSSLGSALRTLASGMSRTWIWRRL